MHRQSISLPYSFRFGPLTTVCLFADVDLHGNQESVRQNQITTRCIFSTNAGDENSIKKSIEYSVKLTLGAELTAGFSAGCSRFL